MMLRVNDEHLDFNDLVELEQQSKLFESIESTQGDFSYAFEITRTSNNMRILEFPLPDVKNKIIYRELKCDLLDNSGFILRSGLLKVERYDDFVIQCSFFSGNYNWFSKISGLMTDLDLSDLDTLLTEPEIEATWQNTEGVVMPIIDTGGLVSRGHRTLFVEDFTGGIYVKTLFKKIFNPIGIKLSGDLFNDPEFDNLLAFANPRDNESIDSRSSFIEKGASQIIVTPGSGTTLHQVTFTEENPPFFDGSLDNYDTSLSRYTADVKMILSVDISLNINTVAANDYDAIFRIYKNGQPYVSRAEDDPFVAPPLKGDIPLDAGDYIELFLELESGLFGLTMTVFGDSTFKATPKFIYELSGTAMVPKWTQFEFVTNILSLFCTIVQYDPVSSTLTINLFEDIKSKELIDLSEYLTVSSVDYTDFISSFFQENILSFEQPDDEDLREYNIRTYLKYGSGSITVENDYIEKSGTLIESPFTAPFAYVNNSFSALLPRMKFVKLDEGESQDFTSVTNNAGSAQFNVPDDSMYAIGDIVRISDTTEEGYIGDFRVKATGLGGGYIVLNGLGYSANVVGTITLLTFSIDTDDNVYLLRNTKYRSDNVLKYSIFQYYFIGPNPYGDVAYSFFSMINRNLPVNAYKQSVSFGRISSTLDYQRTITDKYWNQVGRVLNDPVKLICEAYLPKIVYDSLTPLRPVRYRGIESDGLYYINKISGYKGSEYPCEIELIKLS